MKILIPLIIGLSSTAFSEMPGRFVPQTGRDYEISKVKTSNAPPLGVVRALRMDGQTIGSATAICIDGQPHQYFITAAHVVGQAAEVELRNDATAQVIFADHLMDLALLKVERAHTKCLQLENQLTLMEAFDPTLLNMLWRQEVHVEALDIRQRNGEGEVVHAIYDSLLGSMPNSGILGHDFTGPLVISSTFGLPGMSGGALMSVDYTGVEDPSSLFRMAGRPNQLKFYGMILATSPDGAKVYSLASPVIRARLKAFFNGQNFTPQVRNDGDTIQDRGLGIEFRSLRNAGAPSTKFEIGRFRLGDSGRYRLGDSQTRQASSKIIFNYQGRSWHSVTDNWSEGDPMSPQLRQNIARGRALRGIYSDGSSLRRTDSNVTTPLLLNFEWSMDNWDRLSNDQTAPAAPERTCRQMIGSLRQNGRTRLRLISMAYCEEESSLDERNFMLLVEDPRRDFPTTSIRGRLSFVDDRVYSSLSSSSSAPIRGFSTWNYAQLVQYFRGSSQLPAASPAMSLRQFTFDFAEGKMQVTIENNGPLQISYDKSGTQFEVVAPSTTEAWPTMSTFLTSETASEKFVADYLSGLSQEQRRQAVPSTRPRARRR